MEHLLAAGAILVLLTPLSILWVRRIDTTWTDDDGRMRSRPEVPEARARSES